MPEEIQKFDPSTLMQGVKDRIKATFVSLIPDDQWEQLVNKEVTSFFDPEAPYSIVVKKQEKKDSNSWHTSYEDVLVVEGRMSPFQRIVLDMVIEKSVSELKKYLVEERLHGHWDFTKFDTDAGLQKLIELAIPEATKRFFSSMAFNATNQLRNDILNHRIQ